MMTRDGRVRFLCMLTFLVIAEQELNATAPLATMASADSLSSSPMA